MSAIVTKEIQDSVSSLYIAFFGRAPDAKGFGYWAEEMAGGVSPFTIASNFALSNEWISNYGGLTPTQQVTLFYNNVFDRAPDAAGLAYWVSEIDGGLPFSTVAYQIIWAAKLGGAGVDPADNALVLNKIAVAEYFAIDLKSNDTAVAATAFDGVTQDAATVTAAEARLEAAVNPGVTYTLTTGVNTFTGTVYNDTFDAALDNGANTLNPLDSLNGNGGVDTLNAILATSVTPAALTNIEVLNTTFGGTVGASTLGLINAGQLTNVNNVGSTQNGTFSGIAAGASLGVNGTSNSTDFQFATTAGTQSTGLTLTNVATGGVQTIAGIETINVTSSGTSNVTTLTAANASTVNIAGAANLTLATTGTVSASSFNASTATGNVNLTVVAQTGVSAATDISVTGGTGNDTLDVSLVTGQDKLVNGGLGNDIIVDTAIDAADTVNGGDGVDALRTNTALVAGLTTATAYTNISNIERLEIADAAAGVITLSRVASGINTLQFNADSGATTVTGAVGTDLTVNIGAGTADTNTNLGAAIELADAGTGTADVATIVNNANGISAFSAAGVGQNILSTGYETLNINTTGFGVATTQIIGSIGVTGDTGGTTAETVNFSGSNAVSTGAITADIVNASGLTATTGTVFTTSLAGNATSVTGSGGNDSITSGGGNDTLLGGTGNDTLTAGAGNDNISGGAGNDRIVFAGTLTSADVVDGGEGVNTLVDTSAGLVTASDVALTNVNNIQTIEVSSSIAAGATINTGNIDSTIARVNLLPGTGNALTAGAATIIGNAGSFTVGLGGSYAAPGALGAGVFTVQDTGTATTDSVSLLNTAVNSGTGLNTDVFAARDITSTGYENVTISTGTVAGGAASTIGTLRITPDATTAPVSLTMSGANNASITSLVTTSTALLTVDASAMSSLTGTTFTLSGTTQGVAGTASITGSAGNDVVTVGNFASTIIGGSGNDNLTGGTAADSIDGGDGIDTLTGSGGNDTIRGGAGADSIIATVAGVVSIDGGAGNDTVDLGGTLTAADSVDGGDGVDTLTISGSVLVATPLITNFEALTLSSPASINFSNFTGTNAWSTVTTGTAGTYSITNAPATLATIQVGATASTLSLTHVTDTASDAITVRGLAAAGAITVATLTVNQTDALTLTAGTTAGDSLVITNLNAITADTITITGSNAVTATFAANAAATGTGSSAHGITVDATAATGALVFSGATALATQALTMNGSTTATNNLTGGLGADTITGGLNTDTLVGGAGNDTINAGLGAVSDTVNGGLGADTITLNVDGASDRVVFAADDGVALTALTLAGAGIASGDTISFGNNVDVVTNFLAGVGATNDVANVGFGSTVLTSLIGATGTTATTTATTVYFLSGAYNTSSGVFTVADNGVGADTLVMLTDAATTVATNSSTMILVGVDSDSLNIANFIA